MKALAIAAVLAVALSAAGYVVHRTNEVAHAQGGVALDVSFPGLSSVHVYAHQPDGVSGTSGGLVAASATWKTDSATVNVPAGTYDVRVVHGPTSLVIDDVSCEAACDVAVPLTTLTASYSGLSNVHVYAHVDDGLAGTYGQQVASATWTSNSSTLTMLRGSYDVRVVHGPAMTVLDAVDCSGTSCAVTAPTKTLAASFPGLSNVHVYVHLSDGAAGTYGQQVLSSTWNSDSTSLTFLEGVYDVRLVHGPATVVLDAIDCSAAGPCEVVAPTTTLNASFPGLSNAHVYAHISDGQAGTYGQQVLSSTWKANATSMTLLQGTYDVRVVHGPASLVLDTVECTTSAPCSVDVPLANLTANFPGLTSAHIYAHVTDGSDGSFGQQVLGSTWKSGTTSMTLLRGVYDVRAVHGPATVVIDNVDCTSGVCTADVPLASLGVTFPGLTSAHMYVHVSDAAAGTFGQQVSSSTWKSDATSFVLLAGVYDLRAVHGPVTSVVDGIDCTAGSCSAAVPVTTLTASFPGRSSIHTYVHALDGGAGTYGQQVSASTWKSESTSFVLLRSPYDVRFVDGTTTVVADGVDCTGAACSASYGDAVAVRQADPTATNTSAPAATSTPTSGATGVKAEPREGALVTFLTASCSPRSAIAVAVTGGKDPKSSDNGTGEAVPSDIDAYGCEVARSTYRLYLLGSSTPRGAFHDDGLTIPATNNANDDGWDGSSSSIGAGESYHVVAGESAIRRFSITDFKHPGSAWIGLPYLDLQCWTDGVNNDNADGAGWNGAAFVAGQQVYCIFYFLAEEPEPTPTATPTAIPGATPTAESPAETEDGRVIKELHPGVMVDEETGFVTWLIRPVDLSSDVFVWDANADTCQAFGGARCGGIGGDGGPGAFSAEGADGQHLIVTQHFEVEDNHCAPVVNVVEWSATQDSPGSERQSQRVEYQCSGATALGWPLLAGSFLLAVAAAWYIARRIQWQG